MDLSFTWGDPGWGADSSAVRDQLRGVKQIQATDRAFAAILADGSVVTWGRFRLGLWTVQQFEMSSRMCSRSRPQAGPLPQFLADGSVVTWGDPDWGADSFPQFETSFRGVKQI